MGEAEDILQAILHESETEQRRKALIRDIAQAVAREIPRECPLGLTESELRGLRDLSGCYRQGKVAIGRFFLGLLIASIIGGILAVIDKVGIGWLLK